MHFEVTANDGKCRCGYGMLRFHIQTAAAGKAQLPVVDNCTDSLYCTSSVYFSAMIWRNFTDLCWQLDEKVRDWQISSSTASRYPWMTEQPSWADLIPSAVRFLSDGILGKGFNVLYFERQNDELLLHANVMYPYQWLLRMPVKFCYLWALSSCVICVSLSTVFPD